MRVQGANTIANTGTGFAIIVGDSGSLRVDDGPGAAGFTSAPTTRSRPPLPYPGWASTTGVHPRRRPTVCLLERTVAGCRG